MRFDVAGDRRSIDVSPARLFVAGFTGRDRQAVEAHLAELGELGIQPPPSTPTLMTLDPGLLTSSDVVEVSGTSTSGEAEPVLVFWEGGTFLAVGSDHTDREIERRDIPESKAACPKPVSSSVLALDDIADPDSLRLRSWVDGVAYQEGTLAQISPIDDLVSFLRSRDVEPTDGDFVFLGTIPVIGGDMRFGSHFRGTLEDSSGSELAAVDYDVVRPQA